MKFDFRERMKAAAIQAIGKEPDYVIINGIGEWIKLGKMTESDLAEVCAEIDKQYVPVEANEEITEQGEEYGY